MPSRAAAFSNVTAYNSRAFAARDYRRVVFGGAVVGLGGVSAIAVLAGTVAVAAAWMVSGSLSRNPEFRASAPFALEVVGLPEPPRRLSDSPDLFAPALASADAAPAAPAQRGDELASAAAPPLAPIADVPIPAPRPRVTLMRSVPLPAPRPFALARLHAQAEIARAPVLASAAPATIQAHETPMEAENADERRIPPATQRPERVAALAPVKSNAPVTTGSIDVVGNLVARFAGSVARSAPERLVYNNPDLPRARDSHTAIYDIVAHTVYMPDGERLEAHSGLGAMLDNPHYVSQKGRGPTPPNTYDLTLRSGIFHGVQALRLNPVADSRMYGRDGILAHTYMLGPSGQSFGCVSFKHYSEFLRAFQRGEVNRMVVVTHLPSPPPGVRAEREGGERYAFDLESAH
jgi:Protein of unknown function (DUF2778)